ncbi:MAG: ABC transporter ATP-binding protein [Candidatus Hodarchaeales archaeon]|jgi:putative ABC transport system ATP-binding protein
MDYHISTKNLIKVYRQGTVEVTALRGISVDIERGEFVSIMGPSGSGKSTLMNLIGGISIPTAGTIIIDNEDISTYSQNQLSQYRRHKIGFMWQFSNLLPDLNVIDNLRLAMHASAKFRKSEVKTRAENLLDDVGLLPRAHHRINEVSGGELQRASLALALANDPEIMLADEPTGELDTETGNLVMELLGQMNEKYGKTMIIVTHDPLSAQKTNRTLFIEDGLIIKESGQKVEVDIDGRIQIPKEFLDQFIGRKLKITQTREGEIKLSSD